MGAAAAPWGAHHLRLNPLQLLLFHRPMARAVLLLVFAALASWGQPSDDDAMAACLRCVNEECEGDEPHSDEATRSTSECDMSDYAGDDERVVVGVASSEGRPTTARRSRTATRDRLRVLRREHARLLSDHEGILSSGNDPYRQCENEPHQRIAATSGRTGRLRLRLLRARVRVLQSRISRRRRR